MNSENFEKLFHGLSNEAKLARFSELDAKQFKKSSKKGKLEMIEERQETIAPEYAEAIQRYINEYKGRVQGKQLRSMVKKHFGITVV